VDAVRDLNNRSNGGYQVVGSGTIVASTIPVPGRPMPQNAPVFFHMMPDTRVEGQMTTVPNIVGITVDQAENLLREAGLRGVRLGSLIAHSDFPEGDPRTTNRLTEEERAALNEETQLPRPPILDIIYQQFPSPGVEVERGTEIGLRAR